MNCNETFNAGICYVTDAYKTVCKFNEELHADLEKYRDENAKLRELVQNLRRVTPPDVVGVVIGANTDHPSYYKFDKAFRELGIEVG